MTIVDDLEPLALEWRAAKIPILKRECAEWLLGIVNDKKPLKILEIGTAVGYSGTILAHNADASLISIDQDEKAIAIAEQTFAKFNINAQIICEDGTEAVKDMAQLGLFGDAFDLIFIDHMKAKYLDALEYCIKLSRIGTIIIADNVRNKKCEHFLDAVTKDVRLETKIVDLNEGLSYSVVKHIMSDKIRKS
jgi:predicted O-methyltransferase YrrM